MTASLSTTSEAPLPREWNRLADSMARFHNKFEHEFNAIYEAADKADHVPGGIPRFLQEAGIVSQHLDLHHRIEEAYIFPLLAHKLPQFAPDHKGHVAAHRQIHEGLERYDAYLGKMRADPKLYRPEDLREVMDSFRIVLFEHLDEEVKDLGAKSVHDAGFSLQELGNVPM